MAFSKTPTRGKSQKGQVSGGGAAVLILILAALIVIYILFLPPDIRQELLNDNSTGTGGTKPNVDAENTILVENPGRLDFVAKKEIEHPLPSVNLFTTTKSIILSSQRSLYAKNAWFDKQSVNITFGVDDLENTERVLLVFNIKERGGRLLLKLNGYDLLNEEITSANIDPIELPKRLLQDLAAERRSLGSKHYTKTAKEMLHLLQSCEKNADNLNLDKDRLFVHASAHKGTIMRRRRRKAKYGSRMKTTHLEIMLIERGKESSRKADVHVVRNKEDMEKVVKEVAEKAAKKQAEKEEGENK